MGGRVSEGGSAFPSAAGTSIVTTRVEELLRFRSDTSESAAPLVSPLPLSSPFTQGNRNQATRTKQHEPGSSHHSRYQESRQHEPGTEPGKRTMFQQPASPMEVRPCHPTHTDHYGGAPIARVEYEPYSTNLRSTTSPSPHIRLLQPLITRAVSRGDNTGS